MAPVVETKIQEISMLADETEDEPVTDIEPKTVAIQPMKVAVRNKFKAQKGVSPLKKFVT